MKKKSFEPRWFYLCSVLLLPVVLFVLMGFPAEAQVKDTASRNYQIRINRYEFDPLRNPPRSDTALAAFNEKSDSIYQLIQFTAPLTREQVNTLKQRYRLRLDKYIPNYTYIERVSKSNLKNLQTLPFYRWSGNYEPAYKVSSTIGTYKFKTTEGKNRKGLLLTLTAFPEANADQLKAMLSTNGATQIKVIDERKSKGNLKIQFHLNSASGLLKIASNPSVRYIEEVGESFIDDATTAGTVQSGTPGTTPVWDKGLHGEGQIIGILDGGLVDINHCLFVDNTHTVGSDHRKVVAHHNPSSAISNHATFVAGIACGDDVNNPGTSANRGEAWAARFTDKPRNSSTTLTDLDEAHADGAFIHTNSWHDEPEAYNQLSEDVDNFLYNNEFDFLCGSSGNSGQNPPESIGPPGTAKNALNVSAAQHDPNENNFGDGNNGPATGNRRKPEIFAPGCNINSATAGTNCGINNWGGACATSWATPATAGNAALVRQYYTEGWYPTGTKILDNGFVPTGALIKATLLNSTIDMTGIAGYPGDQEGWGLLRLNNALYFPGSTRNLLVWDVHNAGGIFTGDEVSYNADVQNAGIPLKITLVWTDPAAGAGSTTPLINDLNLTVTAPNGDVFTGNDFNGGQSRANGGTADGVNNVEMVLISTPQVGRYVIRINGANINQGPQGYALVATADTQDPPIPTGAQNTLVVLAQLPGTNPSGAPSQPAAANLMTNLNAYITEASYGVTTINPIFTNVTLTTPLGTYLGSDHNPLIEMTQDVVTQLTTADPNVFTRGTATTSDDISRIVILVNDNSFTGDWATTGGWPYSLPDGLTSRLSVSISSIYNDPDKRLAHAMCHQLGMMDLYNHPGVVFAQPHVDNWDIMANLSKVQPMAWSKEKALWLSTHDLNSILWIPRPAAGGSHNEDVPLDFLSSSVATASRKAIAIGLTPGVTDMANENVFYFIEARSNAAGTSDNALPASGVLLYYVNEDIRQGEGPVRIIDKSVGTPTLDDASLDAVGLSYDLMGSYGLKVTRIAPAGSENTRVRVEYTPIQTQNDMNIVTGDPYWTSPDIWVDAPDNGFDAVPADHGEKPIAGVDNRIYFRIHNPGPGTAFDITVSVRLSEPYHTLGGAADFNRFVNQKHYTSIAAGADVVDFVTWKPNENAEPHNCIKVTIENVFNDVNTYNNSAQQNVDVRESRTHSPYEPVVFHFSVTNPYDYYQLVYFRAEGVPQGWTATFAEPKRLLNARERYEGSITVQPPLNAPVCTDHKIFITSWLPKGNTLIPLGGSTLQINLRQLTTLTATTTTAPCQRTKSIAVKDGYSSAKCYTLTTQGCTDPVQANQDIIIRYEDPQGNPVFRTVKTDAFGCYSDTYVVTEGGEWKVTATYRGSGCAGSSTAGPEVAVVPLPTGNGGNGGNGGEFGSYLRNIWFSAHVGSAHPMGDLNKTADANIYAMADLSFPVNKNLNLQTMYGLAQMTNSNGATGKNPSYTHLSVNAQAIFNRAYDMKPYLRGGFGYYRNQLHTNTMGANIGLGGITAVKVQLLFTPGIDFHCPNLVFSKDERRVFFFTVHLGFLFK